MVQPYNEILLSGLKKKKELHDNKGGSKKYEERIHTEKNIQYMIPFI